MYIYSKHVPSTSSIIYIFMRGSVRQKISEMRNDKTNDQDKTLELRIIEPWCAYSDSVAFAVSHRTVVDRLHPQPPYGG
jgi:hypothetical protein